MSPMANRPRMRGIALLLGLLLLAALSLLAVIAAKGMLLQRHMAANFEDRERARAAAGLATTAARSWLFSRADYEREAGCEVGCLLPAAIHRHGEIPADPEYESAAWWRERAVAAGSHPDSGLPLGATPPDADPAYWLIEEVHFEPFGQPVDGPSVGGIGYYRILGRGQGRQTGSLTVTESIIARPWYGDYEPAEYPARSEPGSFCHQFDEAVACGTLAWRQRR